MRITLARRPGSTTVWALRGGDRAGIPNWNVLKAQGAGPADVVEIPATDPVWRLPVAPGTMPKTGDH